MTDPFLLDQREVEMTLKKLDDAVNVWRQMQKERNGEYSDSLEYEFQGIESSIRNGIRDVKWSLDDLEETLKLMCENSGHFVDSEDLKVRRKFLETARKALADIEFEVSSPSVRAIMEQQRKAEDAMEVLAKQGALSPALCSQSEDAVELLRAGSEEQVVFSKSMVPGWSDKHPKKPELVEIMVSVNLDTVRDLIEPSSYRRFMKSLANWLIRYRCWLFLALLIAFFFVLVIIKAVSRARSAMDVTTTMATTTECAIENLNCV